MRTTGSQKGIMESIITGLLSREIVCLWGNQSNGKTHVFYRLMGDFSIGLDGRLRSEIEPRNAGDYTIDILEGVEAPLRGDRYSIQRMRRQILESYGSPAGSGGLMTHRLFTRLLIDLNDARIIPTLAMDEIEMMPGKAYLMYKLLNQLRHGTERIGLAALLCGNFSKRRMPANFWMHIKEVQVGKVSIAEVKEFMSYLAPGHYRKFTKAAYKRLAECPSTLEMGRVARNAIEYWSKHSKDSMIDTPIVKAVTDKLIYTKHRIAA